MAGRFGKGSRVAWNWGNGTGAGKVDAVFTQGVTRTIKGKEITRNASAENPAYLIVQDDGARVLKSESELRKDS